MALRPRGKQPAIRLAGFFLLSRLPLAFICPFPTLGVSRTFANSAHAAQTEPAGGVRPTAPPANQQSPAKPGLWVEWTAGRLSIDADGASLSAVLKEVARQTGVEIQGIEQLQHPVFPHLSAVPLAEALQKLLGEVNHAIIGDLFTPALLPSVRVVILEPGAEGAEKERIQLERAPEVGSFRRASAARMPVDRSGWTEQQKRQADLEESIQQQDQSALQKALENHDSSIAGVAFEALLAQDHNGAIAALLGESKNDDTQLRLQALQLLDQSGEVDERTVLAALHDALKDEAMNVRQYAVQALARQGGPEAMSYLETAFRDADPTVRLAVLQTVAGKEAASSILQEGLSDSDPMIQAQAKFWLQQKERRGQ